MGFQPGISTPSRAILLVRDIPDLVSTGQEIDRRQHLAAVVKV
jgi:hypothetical protein